MADNYCLFATEIRFPEQAAMDFISLCSGEFDNFPQWFVDKHKIIEENSYCDIDIGIITSYDNGKLYIASEDNGDIDYVAFVLSDIMGHYNIRKPFFIEYAFTCSEPIAGEFGGGVVAIGPNVFKYNSTSVMGSLMINEIKNSYL